MNILNSISKYVNLERGFNILNTIIKDKDTSRKISLEIFNILSSDSLSVLNNNKFLDLYKEKFSNILILPAAPAAPILSLPAPSIEKETLVYENKIREFIKSLQIPDKIKISPIEIEVPKTEVPKTEITKVTVSVPVLPSLEPSPSVDIQFNTGKLSVIVKRIFTRSKQRLHENSKNYFV
jgi:hypothetical protein